MEVELMPPAAARPRRQKKAVGGNLLQVRQNLKENGHGLVQFPSQNLSLAQPIRPVTELPDLPPKYLTERLMAAYSNYCHRHFPILHWPTFQRECEQVYRSSSPTALGRAWFGVFIRVLACGTLHVLDADLAREGRSYFAKSHATTEPWRNEFCVQDVQMAFLTSVFLFENNLKAAGWLWHGQAARIAQQIGLHTEHGQWSPIEEESRRRLWYSVYCLDRSVVLLNSIDDRLPFADRSRLLALELGKPLLIDDMDSDTVYPRLTEDDAVSPTNVLEQGSSMSLLVTINTVQPFQSLSKALKSESISHAFLEAREVYFQSCATMLPRALQLSVDEPLDPCTIAPLIHLQNARLLLWRPNLSPASSPRSRLLAMDQCIVVARETAQVLSRCLDPTARSPKGLSEQSRALAMSASTMLCMHIWRCLLLLLFRSEYSAAIILVQAASAIGDQRRVNVSCGRNIEFFLRTIYSRIQQGYPGHFDHDEELIAYASGDLQNHPDSSWIWPENTADQRLSSVADEMETLGTDDASNNAVQEHELQTTATLDAEPDHWNGWDFIAEKVQYLMELSPQRRSTSSSASEAQPRLRSSSDTSRMTIANII